MSLAEMLNSAQPKMHGLPCPIAVIVAQLGDDDRVVLLEHLEREKGDPNRIPSTVLAQVLTESGHRVHYKGVENHRKMSCRCFTGISS